MPPADRSTFSLAQVAIWLVLPMLVGGAIVYALMQTKAGGGDRPPIIVSDGSIEIQESENADDSTTTPAKGKLEKLTAPVDGRDIWRHDHTQGAPNRLHVLVEGADTTLAANCPVMYFAQNITNATITYNIDGGTRTVLVSKESGNKPVDIGVEQGAGVDEGGHMLTVDKAVNAKLASVKILWKKNNTETTVACQFGATVGPRVVFLQAK